MPNSTSSPLALPRTSRRYNLLAALLAFSVWGGWAFFVNRGAGLATGLTSGLAQGVASFATVLVMIASVTWLARRMESAAMRIFLPPAITVAMAGSCVTLVHLLVGTPHVARTVAPFVVVASGFCLLTAVKLHRARRAVPCPSCDSP